MGRKPKQGPKRFDSTELRKWAKKIDEMKKQICEALTKPMVGRTQFNLGKWNRMNSQQKKLFVFRAMELGFITYEITPWTTLKQ